MSTPQRRAVARHRRRLKRQGLVRLEVKVSRDDAPLVRRVVHALRDDRGEAAGVRDRLNKAIGADRVLGLKELLVAAPLEGIDLSRSRRRPRPVRL